MIDVALLSVIRRWHVREGISIREISRRTKLSRNTIRKHLANLSEAQEPEQTGRLRRVAGVVAEAGIGPGSQGAA